METMQITINRCKFQLGQQVKVVKPGRNFEGEQGEICGFYISTHLYNQPVQEASWHIYVLLDSFTLLDSYEDCFFEDELELVESQTTTSTPDENRV